MVNWLTPAEVVFRLIGRPERVGPIVGQHEKSPYTWLRGSAWRDPGDLPTPRTQRLLLAYAAQHGIPLTARHLIEGADEAEIAALLAPGPRQEDAA